MIDIGSILYQELAGLIMAFSTAVEEGSLAIGIYMVNIKSQSNQSFNQLIPSIPDCVEE